MKTGVTTAMNGAKTAASTAWNGLKSVVSSVTGGIKTSVTTGFNATRTAATTAFNGVKSGVSTAMNAAKSTVSTVCNAFKSTFNGTKLTLPSIATGALNTAKNAVSGALGTIRNAVSGIRLSLPRIGGGGISLPHVSISGRFSLSPPSIPRFSVSWYKNGGIMQDPTVFGIAGNTILAGGEAGAEAILPLKEFYDYITSLLDTKLSKMAGNKTIIENHFYIDGDEVSARTYTRVKEELAEDYKKRR